ncbi:MAG: phage related lysozyme [Roseomonas sp.]|nr:phage related lysozyme [Roseomonas sp.]
MSLLSFLAALGLLRREAPAEPLAPLPAHVIGDSGWGKAKDPLPGRLDPAPMPAPIPDILEVPVANTDPATALTDLLIVEEGLVVYDDATGKPLLPGMTVVGHPTIGIGRCLDRKGITEAEARSLLENDLAEVRAQVAQALPWSTRLTEARQVVLQAMAFQMVIAGLLAFKNTLAMVRAGDYAGGAAGMLNFLWAKQTPTRTKRMVNMMNEG